eukprot:2597650-Pyramimonas_sp.AAC.1
MGSSAPPKAPEAGFACVPRPCRHTPPKDRGPIWELHRRPERQGLHAPPADFCTLFTRIVAP